MTATMTESTTTTMKTVTYGERFAVEVTDPTGAVNYLRDDLGFVRTFSTPNSARKAITRANRPSGDRHR
jgi:hypothetical protein